MKKLFALTLCLCMALTLFGCGGAPEETVPPTTEPTTVATTEPTTEPTTVPTEPPVLYRHPLNGEPLDEPWVGRPTAVVINNIKDALPHYGVSNADIFYEVETESGITRCLAIFDDIKTVGTVGPIRSSRTFFNNIALSYDAPVVHCGGSVRGRNAGYEDSGNKIDGWAHLDATYYEGSYFFRDEDRYYNQGYNWEHTLFSNGEKLSLGLQDREIDQPTDRSSDFGLQFDDEVILSGEAANTVKVTFRGTKTTTFTYDAATGLYDTAQYGSDYIDAATGNTVTFKNLMVLYTDQWTRHDGEYPRSYYTLDGEGDGYLAIDGQIVPIKWHRDGLRSNFSYTLADGTPITLAAGTTYVAIADVDSAPISYE